MNEQPIGGYARQQPAWQAVLSEPAPLAELVIFGYGKHLGLRLTLADGRRLKMGANDITVSTDGAVEMRLERFDDLSLTIRYSGPGVEIHSMQVRFDEPDYQDEFVEDLRVYLANGTKKELCYDVDANIALTAAPIEPAA